MGPTTIAARAGRWSAQHGRLLPATMKLLDWNWYLPRGLAWLPRTGKVSAQRA